MEVGVRVWLKDPGATQLAGKPPLIYMSGRKMIEKTLHKVRTSTGRVNTGNPETKKTAVPETQTDRSGRPQEYTIT